MNRYDQWSEPQLKHECLKRYVNTDGNKLALVKTLTDDDETKRLADTRLVFDKMRDPTGQYEEAHLRSRYKFHNNYWNSKLGSEIQFHEEMLKSKKAELEDRLKEGMMGFKESMKAKNLRIAGYNKVVDGAAGKKSSAVASKSTGSAAANKSTLQPSATRNPNSIVKAGATSAAPAPPAKKVYEPMPKIQSAFHKSPKAGRKVAPKKPAVAPAAAPAQNHAYKPAPIVEAVAAKKPAVAPPPPTSAKKTSEPVPVIDLTDDKDAPVEPVVEKVMAAKKPAGLEHAPQSKKFLTAAGVAYLKALEDGTTPADSPTQKRKRDETEESNAKKPRLDPEEEFAD